MGCFCYRAVGELFERVPEERAEKFSEHSVCTTGSVLARKCTGSRLLLLYSTRWLKILSLLAVASAVSGKIPSFLALGGRGFLDYLEKSFLWLRLCEPHYIVEV